MAHPVLILFLATSRAQHRAGRYQAAHKRPSGSGGLCHRGSDLQLRSRAWNFKGPEADLINAEGQKVGTHFAGPSWKNNDGSLVVGEVVAEGECAESG